MKTTPAPAFLLFAMLSLSPAALLGGCSEATPRTGGASGGGSGSGGEGEGEGGQAGEGEGEGGQEGEGEGEGGQQGEGEGEGGQQGEGEGEGGQEGEGEGSSDQCDPNVPPEPADVDTNWGNCLVVDVLSIDVTKGFDLDDGDGDGDVHTGVDNFLGLAGAFLNPAIADGLAKGSLLLITDLRADSPSDAPSFPLSLLNGKDQDDDPENNFTGEATLDIELTSFCSDGTPLVHFPNASITDGQLVASADAFSLSFPVGDEDEVFSATLYFGRLEADVDGAFSSLSNGNIGGAIREAELREALDVFQPSCGAEEPCSVGTCKRPDGVACDGAEDCICDFKDLVGMFLSSPDTDTDEDGEPDAFSLGLAFTGVSCDFGELAE